MNAASLLRKGLVSRELGQREFAEKVMVGAKKGLTAWGALVKDRAAHNAPFDTGELARSINTTEVFQIGEYSFGVMVGTNLEYAAAQEFGSGIHSANPADRRLIEIEAGYWTGKSQSKSLAFAWPGGPKESSAYDPDSGLFFFRKVYHPGVKAQPYLIPALMETQEEGRSLLWGAVAAELTPTGGGAIA